MVLCEGRHTAMVELLRSNTLRFRKQLPLCVSSSKRNPLQIKTNSNYDCRPTPSNDYNMNSNMGHPPMPYGNNGYPGSSAGLSYYPISGYTANAEPVSQSSGDGSKTLPGHQLVEYTDQGDIIRCECGSNFKGQMSKHNRYNYQRHLMAQGAEFLCDICDKVFNRNDNLQTHREIIHRVTGNS